MLQKLGIETKGALNTVLWVIVALIVFYMLVKPLMDKMKGDKTASMNNASASNEEAYF